MAGAQQDGPRAEVAQVRAQACCPLWAPTWSPTCGRLTQLQIRAGRAARVDIGHAVGNASCTAVGSDAAPRDVSKHRAALGLILSLHAPAAHLRHSACMSPEVHVRL